MLSAFREQPSVSKLTNSVTNHNGESEATASRPNSSRVPQTNGAIPFPLETLQSTATPETVIDSKIMVFFGAMREGSVPKVKSLLRNKNINMNTKDLDDPNEPTALIVACEVNNAEIVKLLLSSKKARSVDVNQEDKAGRKPIWYVKHGLSLYFINLYIYLNTRIFMLLLPFEHFNS